MSLENNEEVKEAAPAKPTPPVAKAQASAPAKAKKDDPHAIKFKDTSELEADLALASIKTMGYKMLEAQVASKNTSAAYKKACEAELLKRDEARAAIEKKA